MTEPALLHSASTERDKTFYHFARVPSFKSHVSNIGAAVTILSLRDRTAEPCEFRVVGASRIRASTPRGVRSPGVCNLPMAGVSGPGAVAASARILGYGTALALVVLYIDKSVFSMHPLSMATAFVATMPEGILRSLSARGASGTERVITLTKHAIAQSASALLSLLGVCAIMLHKNKLGKAHFQSWHGTIGICVASLTLFSSLGGLLAFKRIGLLQKLPVQLQQRVKVAHRYISWATFVSGTLVVLLGLQHSSVYYVRFLVQLLFYQHNVMTLS